MNFLKSPCKDCIVKITCNHLCEESREFTKRIYYLQSKTNFIFGVFTAISATFIIHTIIVLAAIYLHWIFLCIYIPLIIMSVAFAVFGTDELSEFLLVLFSLPGIPLACLLDDYHTKFFNRKLATQKAA
jgi:hypothetical protein